MRAVACGYVDRRSVFLGPGVGGGVQEHINSAARCSSRCITPVNCRCSSMDLAVHFTLLKLVLKPAAAASQPHANQQWVLCW
jgi:hypothetical protein